MQNNGYKVMAWLAIVFFSLYWIAVFSMSLPDNKVKQKLRISTPKFKALFGYTWRLFSPPDTTNKRMYLVVKNSNRLDTIEILENIALQKQLHAPFYQKEMLDDGTISPVINKLCLLLFDNNANAAVPALTWNDSLIIKNKIAAISNRNDFKSYIHILTVFSRQKLKEKKMQPIPDSIPFFITTQMIPPFGSVKVPGRKNKERIIFKWQLNTGDLDK